MMRGVPTYTSEAVTADQLAPARLFGLPEADSYECASLFEAVEQVAVRHPELLEDSPHPSDAFIEIHGMAPVSMAGRINAEDLLVALLEWLDDGWGPLDGSATVPTPRMREAARAFAAAIEAEYVAGDLEHVLTVEVDLPAWAREHRPDLLERAREGQRQRAGR